MKLIVFDWDGTLADSTALIVDALQKSCADLALPIPAEERCRYVIGLGLHDTLMTVAPELTKARYPEMVEAFRRNFIGGEADIPLFKGVPEMLVDLNARGALLGVATGKSKVGLARTLARHGITQHFAATRCADEGQPKPHPEMLQYVIRTCGVELDRTLMIGDTTHDLQLAANAGVQSVAVGYGAHDHEALRSHRPAARLLAHSINELHTHLTEWLELN
jgi:phosphoglycolate phosphatase